MFSAKPGEGWLEQKTLVQAVAGASPDLFWQVCALLCSRQSCRLGANEGVAASACSRSRRPDAHRASFSSRAKVENQSVAGSWCTGRTFSAISVLEAEAGARGQRPGAWRMFSCPVSTQKPWQRMHCGPYDN